MSCISFVGVITALHKCLCVCTYGKGMSVSRNTACHLLAIIFVCVNVRVFICLGVLHMFLWIMHIICRVCIQRICSVSSSTGESYRAPNNITDFYYASCTFIKADVNPPGQCLRTKSFELHISINCADRLILQSLFVFLVV